ncbi:MAG: DUF4328 domain-containing protein [Bryobacterales bacterium]|nr:DUF4328 domain-containing protein [Bryobacterales bacterium]
MISTTLQPASPVPIPVRRFIDRSRAAVAGILAVGVSSLISIVAQLWYAQELREFDPSVLVEELDLGMVAIVYALAALAELAATMIAAFCFLYWFHRAYTNLGTFSNIPRTYGDSWTIWGFAVPILNLYRPYAIMDEIRDRTDLAWEEHPEWVAGLSRPKPKLKLWWSVWIVSNIIANLGMRAAWSAESVSETLASIGYDFAGNLAEIAAVVPAILVIRSITALQSPILQGALAPQPIAWPAPHEPVAEASFVKDPL